jgi:hypothetical protein
MARLGKAPYSVKNPQVTEWNTWGEFVDAAERGEPTPNVGERSSRRESSSQHWDLGCGFDKALKLARDGWQEGREKAADIARRLENRVMHRIVKEDVNYDVEGMGFDVARFLNGEPEHWIKPEEHTMTSAHGNRHVKLVVNVAASCGVSGDAILARGATLAALVELLEYADTRVELWTVDAHASTYYPDGGKSSAPPISVNMVKVKAFDQPLDPGRIAFALAHPAMLRRLCFSMMEQSDESIAKFVTSSHSYGYPTDWQPDDCSIYVGSSRYWDTGADWTSPESCEAWVLARLAQQGIILRDD